MKIEYAIIVRSKTRFESLIERFNTKSQAKFYIESLGGNFENYVIEHETFHNALNSLQTQLSGLIKHKTILGNKIFKNGFGNLLNSAVQLENILYSGASGSNKKKQNSSPGKTLNSGTSG